MKIDIISVDVFLVGACGDDGVVSKQIGCSVGLFERVNVRWVVTIFFETWESRILVGPLDVLSTVTLRSGL